MAIRSVFSDIKFKDQKNENPGPLPLPIAVYQKGCTLMGKGPV